MKSTSFMFVFAGWVMSLMVGQGVYAEEASPAPDLPSKVRSIFLAKCSECHGRGLSRPKAALYLHELGQLAGNREWVVPFEPDKSYVWTLIQNDDMPAKGANAGLLTKEEKEIVRSWIAAGALVPPSQRSSSSTASSDDGDPASGDGVSPSPTPGRRLFAWLGRLHIPLVHFPIALLAAAAMGELIAALRGRRSPDPAVRFCVALGSAAAVATACLGWLHADIGGFGKASQGILDWHRYLGTIAALWALGIVFMAERDSRRGERSGLFRSLLWVGALLVGATGHYGGLMVHGKAFFDW